jgi:hypothetical protein
MIDPKRHPRSVMLDPGREVTKKEIDTLAFQIKYYLKSLPPKPKVPAAKRR